MAIEIGVMLPSSTPSADHPGPADIRASASFAEQAGLGSLWSTDHLVASAPILDSGVVLATAAAVTERITIGFSVMLLALRPVAWAAKQISTLQYVSGNRLVLGVGTGNPAHGDAGWQAAGASFPDRGSHTDAALRVLPDLVTGRESALPARPGVRLEPGGAMPPVLVAANSRRALRRAAEFGDGWISVGLSPQQVTENLAVLHELAAEHGRPTPKPTVVAPHIGTTPEQAADDLAAYAEVGVERVVLAETTAGWRHDYEFAAAVGTMN